MIPDYIISLYENEIRKILKKTAEILSKEFEISVSSITTVIEQEVGLKLELVSEEFETITITRKKGVTLPDANDRCLARLKKKGGVLTQCTRPHLESSCFCKSHVSKHIWGTINDPVPKEKHRKRNMI